MQRMRDQAKFQEEMDRRKAIEDQLKDQVVVSIELLIIDIIDHGCICKDESTNNKHNRN